MVETRYAGQQSLSEAEGNWGWGGDEGSDFSEQDHTAVVRTVNWVGSGGRGVVESSIRVTLIPPQQRRVALLDIIIYASSAGL